MVEVKDSIMSRVTLRLPEETTVDARLLPELYDAYLTTKAKSLTKAAITNYKFALSPFLEWWKEFPNIHRHELTADGFTQFFTWYEHEFRRETGNKTSGYMMNKTAVNLQRFLKWAHQAGSVDRDLSALCPVPSYEAVGKFYPSNSEINALFENLEGVTRLRDAALFALAASTGARRAEIAAIEIEAITFFDSPSLNDLAISSDHSGYVHLRKTKGDSEGRGNGRYSVFDSVAGLLLKLHLHSTRRKAGSLFSLSDDGVRHVVNTNATKAGVFRMHPHAFRSAFIDMWAETNADKGMLADVALKLQVGHRVEREKATMHYLDTTNRDKIVRRIRQFHVSPLTILVASNEWDWSIWPVHIR